MEIRKIDDPNFWGRIPVSKIHMLDAASDAGYDVSYFVMGDEERAETPVVLALRMEPHGVVVRHAHPCERVEFVVCGELHIGDTVLKPGDVMTARPGEMYGPHIAGPEGAVTVEIFGTFNGLTHVTYDTPDGPVEVNLDSGTKRPENVIRL
jgi:hypothetical protein